MASRPAPSNLPGIPAPELPAIPLWADRFAGRNLDAERGAKLAGLPDVTLRNPAGHGVVLQPDSGVRSGIDRRRDVGPALAPPHRGGYSDPLDAAGIRAWHAYALRPRAGLAYPGAGVGSRDDYRI